MLVNTVMRAHVLMGTRVTSHTAVAFYSAFF